MRLATIIALGLLPLLNLAQAPPAFNADPPKVCDACDEWNKPRAPYKVFGNTYYVGTAGLSSVLVTSPAGHILLDGGLAQSASLIDRSIKTLGFATADVRYILASHGHYDHVGGVAALQRASGARVAELPCDILLAPHPSVAEGKTCRTYAGDGRDRLEQRLAEERKGR